MEMLPRSIVFPLILFIGCCSFWVNSADICGGKKISYTIIVDQSGKGKFKTVQAAIDSIQNNNGRWVKVHINAGIYKEKVKISDDKPCIILEGEGSKVTTITYNDHQQTDSSATFTSAPDNVVVKGITFKNSFNLAEALNLYFSRKGNAVTPAVAARIYGDKSSFYDCSFMGFQDTLWDVEGRHYYKNCYIQGAVDFIFGNGQSYFEDCILNATIKELPGFITAQGRNSGHDTNGFVFKGGSIVGNGQVMLGRAYGAYSRVIFHGTYFNSVIAPQGWNAWRHSGQEDNLFYAEAECRGPGADTSKRVHWEKKLSTSQLNEFSLASFINQDGWLGMLP